MLSTIKTFKKLSLLYYSTRNMSTKIKLTQPITFVTSNKNKLKETSSILGESIPIRNKDIDCMTNFILRKYKLIPN